MMTVKKSILPFFMPILWLFPMAFTLIFLLIYTFQSSWLGIVPSSVCILLVAAGAFHLNSLIRFGSKLMVMDSDGITLCGWRVRHIAWKDIEDIQMNAILTSDYLTLLTAKSKKITIHLNIAQLKYSNEEIYSYALEKWTEAADIES